LEEEVNHHLDIFLKQFQNDDIRICIKASIGLQNAILENLKMLIPSLNKDIKELKSAANAAQKEEKFKEVDLSRFGLLDRLL